MEAEAQPLEYVVSDELAAKIRSRVVVIQQEEMLRSLCELLCPRPVKRRPFDLLPLAVPERVRGFSQRTEPRRTRLADQSRSEVLGDLRSQAEAAARRNRKRVVTRGRTRKYGTRG